MARAYVFYRPAETDVGFLRIMHGHVGWAFQLDNGSMVAGGTENPKGAAGIGQVGANKGAWITCCAETDIVRLFAQSRDLPAGHVPGYTHYKVLSRASGDPSRARSTAQWCASQGYQPVNIPRGRNCLDDVYDILVGYGLGDLPWPSDPRFWQPKDWFFNGLIEPAQPVANFTAPIQEFAVDQVSADALSVPVWVQNERDHFGPLLDRPASS